MKNTLGIMAGLAMLTAAAIGETVVRTIPWEEAPPDASEASVQVRSRQGDAEHFLEVVHRGETGVTVPVADVSEPGISNSVYAVRGRVSHSGIEGKAYVELWSHFGADEAYYSRTLGDRGPTRALSGESAWRAFVLPFRVTRGDARPSRLRVNVVLPGPGTVRLGPMEVVEFAPGESPLKARGQWWSARAAGLVGGLLGSAMGILGALIGVLGGSGRNRRLVMTLLGVMTGAGALCLLGGIAALAAGQPYAVYYPLLLTGLIATVLSIGLRPVIRRRCEQQALRKMQSQEL